MELNNLYSFVLMLVLVGMILGVGILVLDKFAASSGVTPAAESALNASRDAVGSIATDWLTLIVTIGVLAIILFMVIRSFVGKAR